LQADLSASEGDTITDAHALLDMKVLGDDANLVRQAGGWMHGRTLNTKVRHRSETPEMAAAAFLLPL
jgi:hypothetical protein